MKDILLFIKRVYSFYFYLGPIQRKWMRFLLLNPELQGAGQLGYYEGNNVKLCCLGAGLICTGNYRWINEELIEVDLVDRRSKETIPFSYTSLGLRSLNGGSNKSLIEIKGNVYDTLAAHNDHNTSWRDIVCYILDNPKNIFKEKK